MVQGHVIHFTAVNMVISSNLQHYEPRGLGEAHPLTR